MSKKQTPRRVLFQLSGSIAAYKACLVISRLVQDGHEVRTAVTRGALEFIGPSTLEGLTGSPVLSDIHESGRRMDHIELARWADVAVLCPASANTLNRLASGLADDAVGALFLAYELSKKPYLIAPAMNHQMWNHPVTQESVARLVRFGATLLPVGEGRQACGETGPGRMLEPEALHAWISKACAAKPDATPGSPPLNPPRVLITGGATRERVDSVRFISNMSTGRTSATLSDELSALGWQVTLLHGQGARPPSNHAIRRREFNDTESLALLLKEELATGEYEAVIHAAAVSDYTVASVETEAGTLAPGEIRKIDSGQAISLKLKKTPKLLTMLHDWAKPAGRAGRPQVVAFKLTDTPDARARALAIAKLKNSGADFIVHNDLSEIPSQSDADSSAHRFFLHAARCESMAEPLAVSGARALAHALHQKLRSSS